MIYIDMDEYVDGLVLEINLVLEIFIHNSIMVFASESEYPPTNNINLTEISTEPTE